jgi:hypothetical protein
LFFFANANAITDPTSNATISPTDSGLPAVPGVVSPFNNIASSFLQTKFYLRNATEPIDAFMDGQQRCVIFSSL